MITTPTVGVSRFADFFLLFSGIPANLFKHLQFGVELFVTILFGKISKLSPGSGSAAMSSALILSSPKKPSLKVWTKDEY